MAIFERHIHIHIHSDSNKELLEGINQKLDIIMATEAQFLEFLNRIDAATNNIAEDLRGLKDYILTLGLDAATEDRIVALLEAKAIRLEELAADTADPVPDEEPVEEPV